MSPKIQSTSSSRRHFLQGATAAGALGFPAIVSAKSPNAKLDVAVIGCGGRGGHNMRTVGNTENIVALVDVNDRNLRGAASRFNQAKTFHDPGKNLSRSRPKPFSIQSKTFLNPGKNLSIT